MLRTINKLLFSSTLFALICTGLACFKLSAFDKFDERFELERAELNSKRQSVIADTLKLSKEDALRFWPIYYEYHEKVAKLDDSAVKILKAYATAFNANNITNEKATKLLDSFTDIEQQRLTLKTSYIKKFRKSFPSKLVWRYFQTEDRLDTTIRHAYIEQVPLVQ